MSEDQDLGAWSSLAGARVGVLGDVMLDHYTFCRAARLSGEAPVPIVEEVSRRKVAGGAANVALNAAALGGVVQLAGVIGDDEDGAELSALVTDALGPGQCFFVIDGDRPTTTKKRYFAGAQQLMRLDNESTRPLSAQTEERFIQAAFDVVDRSDVIVLSDYAKGTLSDRVLHQVLHRIRSSNKLAIVDPKRSHFAVYQGATIITPNRKELALATGLDCERDEEAEAAALVAYDQCGAIVLLTRSEKGLSLFRKGATPVHSPSAALDVYDVSGAGDTVVAALAVAVAQKLPIEGAMRFANRAAALAVGKLGTSVTSLAEVVATLKERDPVRTSSALSDVDDALSQRAAWARQGLTVGLTNGCFDLFHAGHVALLRRAAAECDRLIVALNSDESVARLKGPTRPMQPLAARARVIGAIKGVDLVVSFGEDTPHALISRLQPDVLVKGSDYQGRPIAGEDVVVRRGGRVVLASFEAGFSSTDLARRIAVVHADSTLPPGRGS